MYRFSRLALVVGLSGIACATDRAAEDEPEGPPQPARAALRAEVVGCWALFDRQGRPAEGHIDWAPAFVALEAMDTASVRSPRRPAVRFDTTWSPLPLELEPGIRGWVKWQADSLTDSIRISFSNGFSGSSFVFAMVQHAPFPDTIHGYAREFYDYGPPWSKAMGSTTAVRVPCQTRSDTIATF